MKAAVLGSPVSHSLSPAIFTFLSRELGKELSYSAIELKESEAKDFLSRARQSGEHVGFNVTIPLKELAFNNVDELSPEARGIGASNVVHFKQGKSFGHNTDLYGIAETFKKAGFDVSGKNIFVFGAGGAARAVLYYLGQQKAARVLIYNRSPRTELALAFSTLFPETLFELVSEVHDLSISVMINTTPVGMRGKEGGEGYFNFSHKLKFDKRALAFDLIYTPERTEFLEVATSLGLQTVGGLGMLIDQALASWKIWVGPIPSEDEAHQKLRNILRGILFLRQDQRPLFLTGFMGSGKSTVGKELSRLTGRALVETDRLIEESTGMDIPQIFETKGESFFREQERLIVRNTLEMKNSIISLGGGSLTNSDNLHDIQCSAEMVYLRADEATLNERIRLQGGQRPLMNNLNEEERKEKISTLLSTRRESYERATVTVDVGSSDPLQLSFQILTKLGERP